MHLGLDGKRVLITGASKGIGAGAAFAFAREGASTLHLVARSQSLLEEQAQNLQQQFGCQVRCHSIDLTDIEARENLVAQAGDIDILVNNAGAIPSGSLEVVDDAAWRAGWELKVFGYINLTRAFWQIMKDRSAGVIVNNIGNSGQNPDYNYVAGATANSSLMTFTQALGGASIDMGIRVVGVNSGMVDTGRMETLLRQRATLELGDETRWRELLERYPGGRVASVEDVADLIVFLASERAGYISGEIVTLDGGLSARRSVLPPPKT